MDAKALAKSKRAHSQQHSKKKYHPNPNPKPKTPADGVSRGGGGGGGKANDAVTAAKNPLGKQIKDKTRIGGSSSALPSNWDRYEEEEETFEFDDDPAFGDGPNSNRNPAVDVVLAKSKGADYRHLIAEAQSQPQLDTFPSSDDALLPGSWNMGIGSMLSARGESLLSWIADDNFVVGDKAAAHNEMSFLSLNLHALAEQLEKIDLPQRLFIEADLFPPEQHTEGLEATCSRSSDQMQSTCDGEAAQGMSEESTFCDFSEQVQDSDQDIEITISGSPESGHLHPTSPNLGSVFVTQGNVDPSELGKSEYESKLPEARTELIVKSFEAATAEAELDMLLDSFTETKINDSSVNRSGKTFCVQLEASTAPLERPRKALDSPPLMAANLDDSVDDLINEISILINQSGPSQTQGERAVPDLLSSSHSGTMSKELDDFDSWLDTI